MGLKEVTIIGGGLAGSEAAYQILKRGGAATILEMKPVKFSPAHSLPTLSELVCSNSLKSESMENASGILKEEMRACGSLIIRAAEATRVPAGNTLAVDRKAFSEFVTDELKALGAKIIVGEAITMPEARPVIIATGPLTSDAFAGEIERVIGQGQGQGRLHFHDAVAPIVYRESIDLDKAFFASRYGKGGDDYINCPFTEEEYAKFFDELVKADKVSPRAFEDNSYFERCMPIEVMASRGPKTLLFGPMRPVGLTDPRTGKRPFAVVQLRREDRDGNLCNIVGFQTRLTFPGQKKVFRLIPGLENAEFARFGKLHRNSYIDSPRLLTATQQLKKDPFVFFAGQITGVEGYVESAASGMMAGMNAFRVASGLTPVCPPPTTMTGALMGYISDEGVKDFQPMNANMGLLPEAGSRQDRREAQAKRALEDFRLWCDEHA